MLETDTPFFIYKKAVNEAGVNCAIVFPRKAQYYAEIPSFFVPESFMNSHCEQNS